MSFFHSDVTMGKPEGLELVGSTQLGKKKKKKKQRNMFAVLGTNGVPTELINQLGRKSKVELLLIIAMMKIGQYCKHCRQRE